MRAASIPKGRSRGRGGRGDLVETLPARPHPQEALRTALSTIGRLGPYAVQAKLQKAQGLLYEAERQDLDRRRIRAAASLIRGAAVSLMKAAAGLDRSLKESD